MARPIKALLARNEIPLPFDLAQDRRWRVSGRQVGNTRAHRGCALEDEGLELVCGLLLKHRTLVP